MICCFYLSFRHFYSSKQDYSTRKPGENFKQTIVVLNIKDYAANYWAKWNQKSTAKPHLGQGKNLVWFQIWWVHRIMLKHFIIVFLHRQQVKLIFRICSNMLLNNIFWCFSNFMPHDGNNMRWNMQGKIEKNYVYAAAKQKLPIPWRWVSKIESCDSDFT